MEDIKLFNQEKLRHNINLSLEAVRTEFSMFKDKKDEETIKTVNREFDDVLEEISIMIRYEIDNDSELADAIITICEKYIEAVKEQFNKF